MPEVTNELSDLLQAPFRPMSINLVLNIVFEEGLINEIAQLQNVPPHRATHEHLLHTFLRPVGVLLHRVLNADLCQERLVLAQQVTVECLLALKQLGQTEVSPAPLGLCGVDDQAAAHEPLPILRLSSCVCDHGLDECLVGEPREERHEPLSELEPGEV